LGVLTSELGTFELLNAYKRFIEEEGRG
jgi:hypothetical protein